MTRALLVFLAGIPIRVGYDEKKRGIFLTHKVLSQPKSPHRADHYLNVVESYGVNVNDRRSRLKLDESDAVKTILKPLGVSAEDFLVIIHPGGNWNLKRWPAERFAILVKRLVRELKAKVVITGGENEAAIAQEISIKSEVNPLVLTGKINLEELMRLMSRAKLLISNDSGPLHLASSLGVKTIGLFGPTRPEITGPRGAGTSTMFQHFVGCNKKACYYLECPDNICMQAITVEEVFHAVSQVRHS